MDIRVGFGYDVHRFAEDRPLYLGGILFEKEKGLEGHSDADVLIHAICDALLGAANLGDIGKHFPDNSLEYRNISSLVLLEKVVQMIREKGFDIGNIDSTVCLEKPRLADRIKEMQQKLAETISCNPEKISIKATTTEKLGFTGRGEGISAYAVVLIRKS
jgi:2-C-methyl-D-erythritol 2,4-cyclodiphosphate synthase